MFGSIETTIGIIRMSIQNKLAYKIDLLLSLGFRMLVALLMIVIWTAVYSGSNQSSIGGYTLEQMYVYFILFSVMTTFIDEDIDAIMQTDIRDGAITATLVRPVSYLWQILIQSLTVNALYAVFAGLPVLIIVVLFAHLSIGLSTIALLLVETVLGIAIVSLMGFFVGSMAITFTEIWGLMAVTASIEYLLSGGIMPINLFPHAISSILYLLPFQMLGYIPVETMLGLLGIQQILAGMLVSGAWIAFMLITANFWWKKARRKITSVGG